MIPVCLQFSPTTIYCNKSHYYGTVFVASIHSENPEGAPPSGARYSENNNDNDEDRELTITTNKTDSQQTKT